MSSERKDDLEKTNQQKVTIYKGVPNKVGEQSSWKKFLSWFCPWLKRKQELGDEFLEAEVRNRNADAILKEAEAYLKLSQAEKTAVETAEIAARLEDYKTKDIINSNDFQDKLDIQEKKLLELEHKIYQLRVKYGGRVLSLELKKDLDKNP